MLSAFDSEQFAKSVESVALPALSRGDLVLAATEVYAFAEARHADMSNTDQVACGPGCSQCCAINVSVLDPEADAIANYLQQAFTSNAIAALRQKLNSLHTQTRWLDDEERIMSNLRCGFLDNDGCCMIYPVRPLLCRSLSSTSAEDCSLSKSMLALGEHHPITSCLSQKDIFDAAFLGLGRALVVSHLDGKSSRLTGAVAGRLSGIVSQ